MQGKLETNTAISQSSFTCDETRIYEMIKDIAIAIWSVFVDFESLNLRYEEDTGKTNEQVFRMFKHSVF